MTWVEAVELEGLEAVRKCLGYHDEPLQGKRRGQHSIRLSRGYRAVYSILEQDQDVFINIEEVTKHEY